MDGYFNIWRQMMFCRFIMGVGIGGEYPLSSSITSETSDEGHRGRNVSAMYFLQLFSVEFSDGCSGAVVVMAG